MPEHWRAVKTERGGYSVISYISDDPELSELVIWDQGMSYRGGRWRVYLFDASLVGTIDLETLEKLVGAIRRGAVNVVLAESATTLTLAMEAARRHADFRASL